MSGTSALGNVCHCVPLMVLFDVKWTYAASGSSFSSSCLGSLANPSSSVEAATLHLATMFASLIAFVDQVPVLM